MLFHERSYLFSRRTLFFCFWMEIHLRSIFEKCAKRIQWRMSANHENGLIFNLFKLMSVRSMFKYLMQYFDVSIYIILLELI